MNFPIESCRIFFVDDDAATREMFQMVLKNKYNFKQVELYENGQLALEAYEADPPDVIVTDISMPVMDGLALARTIKAKDPLFPIIAMTAHDDSTSFLEAFQIGFDGYLIKPDSNRDIFPLIKKLYGQKQIYMRLERRNREMEEAFRIADICGFICPHGDFDTQMQADHFLDEMFGIDHTQFTYREFFRAHVIPEDLPKLLEKRETHMQTHEPFDHDLRMMRSDGSVMFVTLSCALVLDSRKDVAYSNGLIQNVTLQRKNLRELQDRESELTLLLDTIPDGAFVWNQDDDSLYLSPRWKAMLGYEDEDLEDRIETFFDLVHEDDHAHLSEAIRQYQEKETDAYMAHFRLRCKNGQYKWIQARGRCTCHRDGRPHKFIGLHQDFDKVMERRQIEQNYLAIYENVNDAILILDGQTHEILDANRAAQTMFGYETNMSGMDIRSIAQPSNSMITRLNDAMAKDAMAHGGNRFELLANDQQGGCFWVEMTLCHVRVDDQARVFAIARNIDDRKNYEEQLRYDLLLNQQINHVSLILSFGNIDMKQLAQKILNALVHLIGADLGQVSDIDAENNQKTIQARHAGVDSFDWELFESSCKEFQLLCEETLILKRPFFTNDPELEECTKGLPGDVRGVSNFLSIPILAEGQLLGQIVLANKSEAMTSLDLESASRIGHFYGLGVRQIRANDALRESEEKYKKLAGWLEDTVKQKVDELREKDQVLIQQSKMAAMGDMLGAIAHQWRQPLTVISSSVAELQIRDELGKLGKEDLRMSMDSIAENTQTLSAIIDDFMYFFRPDRQKITFSLAESLCNVKKLLETQFLHQGITIELDVDESYRVKGYQRQLEQVILNLFINSRDAYALGKHKEKRIFVSAEYSEEAVKLFISDRAGGIPESAIDKVFDPYFTTKEESGGSGIGLYMSKMIIEKNFESHLYVKNIIYNDGQKGAHFTIVFCKKDG